MENDLIAYYQKRAQEYEKIYQKPERQEDLQRIKNYLSQQFFQKNILEIACGTGYWTTLLANQANSILAIDINQSVLDIAQSKVYPRQNVTFQKIDFKNLSTNSQQYNGLFGGFIWSHILKENLPAFIKLVFSLIPEKGQVIFLDNRYVEGSSTSISRTDKLGNTFQTRTLASGERYEVLKNFPEEEEIRQLLKDQNVSIEWIDFDYYWLLNCRKDFKQLL